jgi:16S rRNA (guanine966-N2)-methyltransferase
VTQKHRTLRIIGGRWRRQRLSFPDIPELRPTHDRVRETLFNWLMSDIQGARCLDLFAGSGALGFEALSRGAKQVSFVDSNPEVIDYIKKTAKQFGLSAKEAEVVCGRCPQQSLSLKQGPYDVIFLDAPFFKSSLLEIKAWLEHHDLMAPAALIYVETESAAEIADFSDWRRIQQGKTATLAYYLFQKEH